MKNNLHKFLFGSAFLCAFAPPSFADELVVKRIPDPVPNPYHRSGFYLGADLIRSHANHEYKILDGSNPELSPQFSKNKSTGFGVNAGYKLTYWNFFVAPEIFYDYLGNGAKDFGYPEDFTKNNSLNLTSRYGGKVYLGYNIFSRINLFVDIGGANTSYSYRLLDGANHVESSTKLAMVYGAGAFFAMTSNWRVKAAYDFQRFAVRYNFENERDIVTLKTFKLGLAYNF